MNTLHHRCSWQMKMRGDEFIEAKYNTHQLYLCWLI